MGSTGVSEVIMAEESPEGEQLNTADGQAETVSISNTGVSKAADNASAETPEDFGNPSEDLVVEEIVSLQPEAEASDHRPASLPSSNQEFVRQKTREETLDEKPGENLGFAEQTGGSHSKEEPASMSHTGVFEAVEDSAVVRSSSFSEVGEPAQLSYTALSTDDAKQSSSAAHDSDSMRNINISKVAGDQGESSRQPRVSADVQESACLNQASLSEDKDQKKNKRRTKEEQKIGLYDQNKDQKKNKRRTMRA